MAAPLELPDAYRTTAMLEAAIDEARDAVDAATDHQTLKALFDNILTTLADPDAHREVVSGILAGFRDGASLGALKRAVKQFLNRLVPATGGSTKKQRRGFIQLMVARHFLKRTGESYYPPKRQKQMPDGFDITLMKKPSKALRNMFETFGKPATKKTLLERIKSGEVKVEGRKKGKGMTGGARPEPPAGTSAARARQLMNHARARAQIAIASPELRVVIRNGLRMMLGTSLAEKNYLQSYFDWFVENGIEDTDEDEAEEVGGARGMTGGRYKLRKAPGRPLFWVVGEDGKHHSKEPLPKERAEAQMRALYRAMEEEED